MNGIKEEQFMEGIAIIGMAGRFPLAKDVEEFWQNVRDGVECVTFLSPGEDQAVLLDPSLRTNPLYVPAGAFVDGIDLFDATFFGYTTREAQMMDPQQRLFLECAWEVLERAGYDTHQYQGRIGIYAGSGINSYLLHHIYRNRELITSAGRFQMMLHNDRDFLATRVAYKLGLKGPALTVQTACSTSLVAVFLACQGLLSYQCDMALAGGVSLPFLQRGGYIYEPGGVASSDGHCRAFDEQASGALFGNGLGIVALKRLEDALADGDQIYAVIKGSAVNNDGDSKMGYTAPSVEGQSAAIIEALALAGFEPETIGYVETHGTGTSLGDPIEIAALTTAFHTDKKSFCAIGSVKTNIGHLDAAAGIAGLIKTSFALKHKVLPPSLNFTQPNSQIDFANCPFYVNTQLADWLAGPSPRRAGVSAFGIGGTNAHIVLEEAPEIEELESSKSAVLLVLSAKTASALETATTNLVEYLKIHLELNLADVAYCLQTGRRAFAYRRMVVCQTHEEAVTYLQARDPQKVLSSIQEPGDRSLVFLFPGLGSQYVRMGQQLYEQEPTYRQWIDYCAERLNVSLGLDLRQLLFPSTTYQAEAAEHLQKMRIAPVATFITTYALACLLEEWGLRPQSMIGHDVGEYVAACIAGVMSVEDALFLLGEWGRLAQELPQSDSLLNVFRQVVKNVTFHEPRISYLSSVTGMWITSEEATCPDYWAEHLQQPIRFAEGLSVLQCEPGRVLVEVGPGQNLKALCKQLQSSPVISTMRDPLDSQPEWAIFLQALGTLWLSGIEVDWSKGYARQHRRRVLLPTYPFERQHYWIEMEAPTYDTPGSIFEQNTTIINAQPIPVSIHPRPDLLNAYVEPQTETERKVAAIWQEHLGIENIGIYDNFFELGGASLLAIRLLNRMREAFGVELSERQLYEQSTIAELSEAIEQSQQTWHAVVPSPRDQPLLASWHQNRLWARDRRYPEQGFRHNMAIGAEIKGPLNIALFKQALDIVIKRHETLRTSFVEIDDQLMQTISPPFAVPLPLIDLADLSTEEQEAELLKHAINHECTIFDMRRAPLWRMTLFRLAEDLHVWIITAHQSIWDGISTHVVLGDMSTALKALMEGQSDEFTPLIIQHADVVQWERQRFQGELLEIHLSYWRRKLAGNILPLNLPIDHLREQGYALSAVREWTLPDRLVSHLKALTQKRGVTLYMLLLTVLEALCYKYTGQDDILIDTAFSNRDQKELQPLVGPLANFVTLRVDLSGNPDFSELLGRVKETVLEAISHSDFPFAKVLEEMFPQIYPEHTSLGRILFALYPEDPIPNLPNLAYEPRIWPRRAINDLYIYTIERKGHVQITWEYDTHLFDDTTISRIFNDYISLLEQIVSSLSTRLSELTIGSREAL